MVENNLLEYQHCQLKAIIEWWAFIQERVGNFLKFFQIRGKYFFLCMLKVRVERGHFASIGVRTWNRFTCTVDLRVLYHVNCAFLLMYLHSSLIFMAFLSVTLSDNNPLGETESNSANRIRLLAFYNIKSLHLVGL